MNVPEDSTGDKSTDFQSPNISFLNIPNYQKHSSQKCNFSPIEINTESQYIASPAFQRQESCRKEGMTRGNQLSSLWIYAPLYTLPVNIRMRKKHSWITIFSKSSKQREPLSLFESILFKEGTWTRHSWVQIWEKDRIIF